MSPEVTYSKREYVDLVVIDNAHARAEISLLGGQVLSFIPKDGNEHDRLWVSPHALWDKSKPVRGGIPVCWPWFGQHRNTSLPAHGFVRTQTWKLREVSTHETGTELVLRPSFTLGRGLEGETQLELNILVGKTLSLTLTTRNTGDTPIPLGCALHTYFSVSDIHDVELRGLGGKYSDKTRDWAMFDTPEPYRFTEETDRIHLQPATDVEIVDAKAPGNTRIQSGGHDSIVVWNPWPERAGQFPDMQPEDYRSMLCVEIALTQDFVLQPGQIHHLSQRISVSR